MSPVATSAAREIAQLRATLEKGDLPEVQKKRGAALLDRLASPVRLTILGLPGSGFLEDVLPGLRGLIVGFVFGLLPLAYAAVLRVQDSRSARRAAPPPTEAGD